MTRHLESLPSFVEEAKRTVPSWIEEIRHPDGSDRYRAAVDAYEPHETYSLGLLRRILTFVREDGLTETERRDWIERIADHQREDGMFRDQRLERHLLAEYDGTDHIEWLDRHGVDPEQTYSQQWPRYFRGESLYWIDWTTSALSLLDSLGGEPEYPVPHELPADARVDDDRDPWDAPPRKFLYEDGEEMRKFLESLDWSDPWGASQWTGRVVSRHRLAETFFDEEADDVVEAAVEWLSSHQDPETGAWFEGDVPRYAQINGIYKIWKGLLPNADFPIQRPESVIDLCIEALESDPRLTGTPDSLCIWDVSFVLNIALDVTDYRRDEVGQLAAQALPKLEAMYRPDGAFSYTPHGSIGILAPFKLSPAKNQSDVGGTTILLSGIAELSDLCGLREEWGWHVPSESYRAIV
jgi:hypothetical protein